MPELPDLTIYVEALSERLIGATLERVRIASPSLLRSVDPPISAAEGRRVSGVRRLAKRIVIGLEAGDDGNAGGAARDDETLFLVVHLMIAGRFHWKPYGAKPARKGGLAAFDFAGLPSGARDPKGAPQTEATLLLTEVSTKKRASLYVARGEAGLAEHDPGGLEVFDATFEAFRERLLQRNHTLKRALSDPQLFAGIGNAYSDEILHHARLSPVRLTQKLDDGEIERLFASIRSVVTTWIERLRAQRGDRFPEKVTAFRPEMAAHGRYGEPCPDCGAPIQRIVYASNQTHYCAPCQTGGKLLADRALSRLLKRDWPRSLEELEQRRSEGSAPAVRPRR